MGPCGSSLCLTVRKRLSACERRASVGACHLRRSAHLYLCPGGDWAVTVRTGLGCVYEGAALIRLLCPCSAQHLRGPVLCLWFCSWLTCLPESPAEERGCCVRVSVHARVPMGLCAMQMVLCACSVHACRQHWVFGACTCTALHAHLVHACRQHCMYWVHVWVHTCRQLCVHVQVFGSRQGCVQI